MKNITAFINRTRLMFALLALALAVQAQTKEVKMITSTDQLTLHPGWNLIPLDVIPTPATPEAVFAPLIAASNLEIVTGFQNQMGVFFDPAGLPFLNTLTGLVPGEGYWVKVTNEATLSVTGEVISPTFAINLKTGWNLVAYWPSETTTPEAAFADLITAGKLLLVTGYELGGKFFDPAGPPFLNTLTEVKNGFGYWVKLSANYNGFLYPTAWQCDNTFTDIRDGKTYSTVQIGDQCWMKQNLNVGIRISSGSSQTDNGTLEKYCYNNDEANCDVYGGSYRWGEAMSYSSSSSTNPSGIQGICPVGWHLPADAEWCQLTSFLDASVNCNDIGWSGTDAGCKLKEAGTSHWTSPNTCATNQSNFTALPGGYIIGSGSAFGYLHDGGSWWSATESSGSNVWGRHLNYYEPGIYRDPAYFSKQSSYSIRCLKDN